MRILPIVLSCGLAAAALASPATPPPAAPPPAGQPPGTPAPRPPAKSPLDTLFAQLARAQSPEEAQPIEDRIFALFEASGSASIDLLMTRGSAAEAAGDHDTAKKLFAAVTGIAPNYAEGWHARAQLESEDGNDEAAMLSLQKTVSLNPRQFAAMGELADLLDEYGNKAGALKLYRRALALDPQLDGAAAKIRQLERDVEGQGI